MKNIDEIGKNIVEKNIEIKTQDKRQCKFCSMAYFCKRTWLSPTKQYNFLRW